MVVEVLDGLRERNKGCRTAAFADLSAQMILVTDAGSHLPRESLDSLCDEAVLLLGPGGRPALGDYVSNAGTVMSKKALRVFVRGTQDPNDVICCICDPSTDISELVVDARTSVDRISSGE